MELRNYLPVFLLCALISCTNAPEPVYPVPTKEQIEEKTTTEESVEEKIETDKE